MIDVGGFSHQDSNNKDNLHAGEILSMKLPQCSYRLIPFEHGLKNPHGQPSITTCHFMTVLLQEFLGLEELAT